MGINHPTDLRRDLFGRCLRKRNRQDALAQPRVLKVRRAGVSAGRLEKKLDRESATRHCEKAGKSRSLLLSPSRRKSTNRLLCRRSACLADYGTLTQDPGSKKGGKKVNPAITHLRTEAVDHVVPVDRRVCFHRQRGSREHRNVHARRALRARVLAAEERVPFLRDGSVDRTETVLQLVDAARHALDLRV